MSFRHTGSDIQVEASTEHRLSFLQPETICKVEAAELGRGAAVGPSALLEPQAGEVDGWSCWGG